MRSKVGRALDIQHANKKKECNNLQDQMDQNACKYAVDIKDSCEEYAECYNSRREAYDEVESVVKGTRKKIKDYAYHAVCFPAKDQKTYPLVGLKNKLGARSVGRKGACVE